jgi:hypothetical protein
MLFDALANMGSAMSVERSCRAPIEVTRVLCQIPGTIS